MNGQTRRSRLYHDHPERIAQRERKYGDKTTAKYYIYFLNDVDGNPIYIGRSVDPASRLRTHRNNQGNPNGGPLDTSSWFPLVDHMETIGPFPWDEAVAVEREEIGKHQPLANRDLTARDHRPAVAADSQAIRDAYLAELAEVAS